MSKSAVLLILGLAVGLAAGAWGMRLYFNHTLGSWSPLDRFVMQLDGDLHLTADQRGKVADILAAQKSRMEDLRGQWRIQVVTLDRQGEDRIARLLTPAQMQVFIKLHDRIHGRMDRFLWTSNANPTALAIAPSGR